MRATIRFITLLDEFNNSCIDDDDDKKSRKKPFWMVFLC